MLRTSPWIVRTPAEVSQETYWLVSPKATSPAVAPVAIDELLSSASSEPTTIIPAPLVGTALPEIARVPTCNERPTIASCVFKTLVSMLEAVISVAFRLVMCAEAAARASICAVPIVASAAFNVVVVMFSAVTAPTTKFISPLVSAIWILAASLVALNVPLADRFPLVTPVR